MTSSLSWNSSSDRSAKAMALNWLSRRFCCSRMTLTCRSLLNEASLSLSPVSRNSHNSATTPSLRDVVERCFKITWRAARSATGPPCNEATVEATELAISSTLHVGTRRGLARCARYSSSWPPGEGVTLSGRAFAREPSSTPTKLDSPKPPVCALNWSPNPRAGPSACRRTCQPPNFPPSESNNVVTVVSGRMSMGCTAEMSEVSHVNSMAATSVDVRAMIMSTLLPGPRLTRDFDGPSARSISSKTEHVRVLPLLSNFGASAPLTTTISTVPDVVARAMVTSGECVINRTLQYR
mmetsp:Transcript_46336/g.123075  ORF Transcript_46336/g.123075 Transcript_46336/m.123075 type:complete len:295 (+) Transcript_46336:384-1268(+)